MQHAEANTGKKGFPMARTIEIQDIVDSARQEMLFAIKERITELTRGTTAPVQLRKVVVRDATRSYRDSMRYFEVQNVFIDERGRLCGDLVGRDDRISDGVLFGKEIEDLLIDDFKLVLDSLYGSHWSVDLADYENRGTPAARRALWFPHGRERRDLPDHSQGHLTGGRRSPALHQQSPQRQGLNFIDTDGCAG